MGKLKIYNYFSKGRLLVFPVAELTQELKYCITNKKNKFKKALVLILVLVLVLGSWITAFLCRFNIALHIKKQKHLYQKTEGTISKNRTMYLSYISY